MVQQPAAAHHHHIDRAFAPYSSPAWGPYSPCGSTITTTTEFEIKTKQKVIGEKL